MASNPTKPGTDTWTTLDEKQTLDKMGTFAPWRNRVLGTETRRKILFDGAKEAYSKRVEWGKIDPEEINKYLMEVERGI